jgi:hypothetical protein
MRGWWRAIEPVGISLLGMGTALLATIVWALWRLFR